MLKKILVISLILTAFSLHSQNILSPENNQYSELLKTEKELEDIIKARKAEVKINNKELNLFLKDYDGNSSKEFKKYIINKLKEEALRKEFFLQNPEKLDLYKNTPLNIIECKEERFEEFTFYSSAISNFNSCNNSPDPLQGVPPIPINDISESVSIVEPGVDPLLELHEIYVSTTLNSSHSIRLNDIAHGGNDVTRMERVISEITTDEISVDFFAVMENPGHHRVHQPYLQIELKDENNHIIDSRCIIANYDGSEVFKEVQGTNILYNEWNCVTFNTEEIIGKKATLEITVGDCGQGGHFGYVYIDNCLTNECDSDDFTYEGTGDGWPRTYGNQPEYKRYSPSIEVDKYDNVYTIGTMEINDITHEDNGTFNSEFHGYIMKHNKHGEMIWYSKLPLGDTAGIGRYSYMKFLDFDENPKLVVSTASGYLGVYDANTGLKLDEYQITQDQSVDNTHALDVNSATGEIYLGAKFKQNFSNSDYVISATSNVPKLAVFKFKINQGNLIYQTHKVLNSDRDRKFISLVLSKTDNNLYITSKRANSVNHGYGYLGFQVSTTLDNVVFSDWEETRLGLLALDNNSGTMFLDKGDEGKIYKYVNPSDFLIGPNYNIELSNNYTDGVSDIFYNHNQNSLLVVSNTNPKVISEFKNDGTLVNYETVPENTGVEAIAGYKNTFITGHYWHNSSIQGSPLQEYSVIDIFIMRLNNKRRILNKEMPTKTFSVLPNPTDNTFKIVSKNYSKMDVVYSIKIFDTHGILIKEEKLKINESYLYLDGNTGVYFGKIYQNGELIETVRIIKR